MYQHNLRLAEALNERRPLHPIRRVPSTGGSIATDAGGLRIARFLTR